MAKVRKRGNTYQIDYRDPTGKRIRKSFKKLKDAEAELGKRVSLVAEGRYLDVKKDYKITLKELIDKYEENYKGQASYLTFKKYAIENIRKHFGEETRLSCIRYVDLETYRNHLKEKLTKHETIRKEASMNLEMACLRHLFSKAEQWEMVERSPFARGKSLTVKENNKRLRFLSQEEIGELLKECPPHLKPVVVCGLNTGMRRSEILSLKWDQIRNGFIYLQKTKTNEARQIPVNDDLTETLKGIRKEKQLKSEYVFTFGKKPVQEVKRSFAGAMKRAGIDDFRFHDLRHTFASHLVMKGATIKDVQELLGHKDTKMTNRYAHLSPEHKQKAVSLLNGLTAYPEKGCHKMVTFSNSSNRARL